MNGYQEEYKGYIYRGGLSIVKKSGVGSAICHQEKMMQRAGIPVADSWQEGDVIHVNTVFPDSVLAACIARRQGKRWCITDILQWRISGILLSVLIWRHRCSADGFAAATVWEILF